MALDEPLKHEKTYTINDVEVIIADGLMSYTEGVLLDFISDERGEGFVLGPADGESSSDNGCGCS
ncbi:MAG: hypothetical protein C0602_06710 [Denitrovibrio sp.]|nr:MAG: hypothetical protein C0602_06710 [Denitrovibrio sp.]